MFSLLPPPNQAGVFNFLKVIGAKNNADAFDVRTDYYATQLNFDFSVFKGFSLTEKLALEFRAEFFNFFNTPRFLLPNRSVDTAQGGVISAAGDPRLTQLALRLKF